MPVSWRSMFRSKLPEVQQTGAQLNTVTTNFGQLESAVTKAVGVTSQGITVVNQVDGTLPALTDFGKTPRQRLARPKMKSCQKSAQHLMWFKMRSMLV